MALATNFGSLPLHLLEHMFSYLTAAELNVAADVSRRWLGIAAAEATKPSRREEVETTFPEQCKAAGVGWLRMLAPEDADEYEALNKACAAGNLAVVKWIVEERNPKCDQSMHIEVAGRHGRQAVLRWLKRKYFSTAQEMRMVRVSLEWLQCDLKTQRHLGEHYGYGQIRTPIGLYAGDHEERQSKAKFGLYARARLDLAKWYADHRAGYWDIKHVITGGCLETAQWLIEQFGAPPPLNSAEITAMVLNAISKVENLRALTIAYDVAPADASKAMEVALAYDWLETPRWLTRRYGSLPPTAPVGWFGDRSIRSMRWSVEWAGTMPNIINPETPPSQYLKDAYGL